MDILSKISPLMKEQNKQQKDLTEFLGVHKNAYTDWKSGKSKSYKKYLYQIADYLGVTHDYLLGKTDKKEKPTDSLFDGQSEQLERINDALRDLPDEAATQVLAYAELLKLKYKQ